MMWSGENKTVNAQKMCFKILKVTFYFSIRNNIFVFGGEG